MIENIRKYTGLMIVVLVLLFVGLVFIDSGSISRALGGKPVMQVGDDPISEKEFSRQTALLRLSQALPGQHPLPRDTRILASKYLGDAIIDVEYLTSGRVIDEMARYLQVDRNFTSPERFITNRINIQKAGLEYGVTPGDEEVESFVENVLFADPEGNFDQAAYSEFRKSGVSRIGGNRGFNEYIRDLLTAQNLAKVIGGGLAPEMETVRMIYDTQKQVVTAKQVSLDAAPLEGEVDPTAEEIKAYFEENRDKYKSDELRKVSYVLIEPDWEETLKTVTEEKKKAAEERAKKEAEEKKKAEELEKKNAEIKKKAEALAEEANKVKDGESPAEEPTPTETPTQDPAEGSNTGDTPAPTEEATETPAEIPAENGQQGDPGDPGEQADPPVAPDAPASSFRTGADKPAGSADLNKLIEEGKKFEIPTLKKPLDLPKTPKEQLNSVEKDNAVKALTQDVSDFYDKLNDNLGKDFEKIAKDSGYEVKTTDFFSREDPPELFSTFVRGSGGTVADAVFKSPISDDPYERLGSTLQTPDGWIIFRFDEVTDAVPLPFEKARVQATIDLRKKMAREVLVKKAKDLGEKLSAAIAGGKTFEEAAKDLELKTTDLKDLKEGQYNPYFGGRNNPPEFEATKFTNSGEIAPVKFIPSEEEPTKALILFVDKREVVKDAQYFEDLDTTFKQRSRLTSLVAFENWLTDRYNESNVIPPATEE